MPSRLPRLVSAAKSGPISNHVIPAPKVLRAVHNQQVSNGISLTAGKAGDPEFWAFGRCVAEGQVVAADDSSGNLVIDVQWSRGEIEEFEHRIVAGIREGLGTVLGDNEHFVGTSGQAASTILTAILGSYDALPDRAHSVLTLKPQFQPKSLDIRMLGKWLKVVDPRNSPAIAVYSTNPALILARILLDSGYSLDYSSVATCADYCDELVSGSSPAFKRWEIAGQIKNRRQLRDWLETMSAYANCFIDIQGGTASLVPDTPRAANHTLTADDMLERSVRRRGPGKGDVPDAVTVVFQKLYVQAEEEGSGDKVGTISSSITFGASTGAGSVTTLQMPFFPDFQRAGRKAEEAYYRAGNMLELEFTGFDSFLARTVGDVGTITNAAYGLTAQKMILLENTAIDRGRWRALYVKYADENYSDNYYSGTYNFTDIDTPEVPIDGPDPSVIEEHYTPYAAGFNESYSGYQRLVITWTGVSSPYVRDYYIVIKEDGSQADSGFVDHVPAAGSPLTAQTHTYSTTFPLVEGALYEIEVYVRTTNGEISENPGTASIVASVLFYSSDQEDRGGAYNAWTDPENAIVDDGSDATYAYVEWEVDEESETDWLSLTYSLADNGVPDSGTIENISVLVRARKRAGTEVVNIKDVHFVDGAASPEVVGDYQAAQEVDQDFNLYLFSGDLTDWGMTNAEAMTLFDDSGNGRVRLCGECEDTSIIGATLFLRVDWVKVGVSFS